MRSPRVRCHDCRVEWFGPAASHGLRVVGACPRCDGHLDFLEETPAVPVPSAQERALRDVEPARVLGTPVTWAARSVPAPQR